MWQYSLPVMPNQIRALTPAMLEPKALIIPLFYHAIPAQLRWTLGYYDQPLKLMKRCCHTISNTVKHWRNWPSQIENNSALELEICSGWELNLTSLYSILCLRNEHRWFVSHYFYIFFRFSWTSGSIIHPDKILRNKNLFKVQNL